MVWPCLRGADRAFLLIRFTIIMSKLTIVANIYANAEKADFVKSELQKLIPPTLAEKGCLQYDLHVDNEDPAHFLFYENWESRELWQVHMDAPHIAAFQAVSEGCIDRVELYEMECV